MRVLTIKRNTNGCFFGTFYKVLWCVNPGLAVEVFQVRSSEELWWFSSFITNLCLLSRRQWQWELRNIINCGWEVQTQKEWFLKMMVTVEILLFSYKNMQIISGFDLRWVYRNLQATTTWTHLMMTKFMRFSINMIIVQMRKQNLRDVK